MLNLCLLGSGGTMPLPKRFLSSLLISCNGRLTLIDCGEGTQVAMKVIGWGFKALDMICFTHFHGDHFFGLPGLLMTLGNSGRTEPVKIMGPTGLWSMLSCLDVLTPMLPFDIEVLEVSSVKPQKYELEDMVIQTLPLQHTGPCIGYSFNVSRKREFQKEKALSLNIPINLWKKLQNGFSVKDEDKEFTPDMVLGDERKGIKLTYCTDTRPIKEIIQFAYESDLFICEGMYGDQEEIDKAIEKNHMTFNEAAELALRAQVKELLLTHYSPSLNDPMIYLDKTRETFMNTNVGYDGFIKEIKYDR